MLLKLRTGLSAAGVIMMALQAVSWAQESPGVVNPFAPKENGAKTPVVPKEKEASKKPPVESTPAATEAKPPADDAGGPPATESPPPSGLGGGQKPGTSWTVIADGATNSTLANLRVSIPVPGLEAEPDLRWERSRTRVIFPDLPSPFAALGLNEKETDIREVWDLQKNVKLGTVTKLALEGSAFMALSPDGALFAAKPQFDDIVEVVDVAQGKVIRKLAVAGVRLDLLAFTSPTRLLVGENNRLRMFALPEGTLEREVAIDGWKVRDGWALSPGGRYLAAFVRDGDSPPEAVLVDLTDGTRAGQLVLASGAADCQGLAFSRDGQRLASAIATADGSVLEVFDLTTPAVLSEAPFDAERIPAAQGYQGHFLEWLPDGARILVAGRDVVEIGSGTAQVSLLDRWPYSVFPFSDASYLSVQGQTLGVHSYGAAPSVAAAPVKTPGHDPDSAGSSDSGPPVLTADRSAAVAQLAMAPSSWDVRLQSPPAYPDKLATEGFRIPGGNIQQILLSSENPPCAIVSYADASRSRKSAPAKKAWIERFNLVNGENRGIRELPFPAVAAGVSPDGSHVATIASDGSGRIDVWSFDNDRHVVGFRAAGPSANDINPWFVDFVDQSHLMVVIDDELSLWSIPQCQAIYTMSIGAMRPAFSPAREHVAVAAPGRAEVVVIESLTGTPRGGLRIGEMPGEQIAAAAFHHRGRWLAAVSCAPGGGELVVVDTGTGRDSVRTRLPISSDVLQWCGDDHVLLGGADLVNLTASSLVWRYELPLGLHCREPIDARHWYVAATSAGDKNFTLVGVSLPEEAALPKIKTMALRNDLAFKPGDAIRLDVQAGQEGARSVGALIVESLTKKYEEVGTKVSANAATTLIVRPAGARSQPATPRADVAGVPNSHALPNAHSANPTGPQRLAHAPAGITGPGSQRPTATPSATPPAGTAASLPAPSASRGDAPPGSVWELTLQKNDEALWRTWIVAEDGFAHLENNEEAALAARRTDATSVKTALAALLSMEPAKFALVPGSATGAGVSRLTTSGPRPAGARER